jgi:hypothetical protein
MNAMNTAIPTACGFITGFLRRQFTNRAISCGHLKTQ